MKNTYFEEYKITEDNSASTNEKAFLKMMSELGGGISLASTSYTPNTPTSTALFNNWTKKTYDEVTGNSKPSNCY